MPKIDNVKIENYFEEYNTKSTHAEFDEYNTFGKFQTNLIFF